MSTWESLNDFGHVLQEQESSFRNLKGFFKQQVKEFLVLSHVTPAKAETQEDGYMLVHLSDYFYVTSRGSYNQMTLHSKYEREGQFAILSPSEGKKFEEFKFHSYSSNFL